MVKGKLFFFFFFFSFVCSYGQIKEEIEKIQSKYNLNNLENIKDYFQKENKLEQQQALQIAKQQGWNTKFTTKKGSLVELQRVVNGKPIYYTTFNVAAAKSTRTNHLNSGGSLGLNLMGQGMIAHIWDAGLARITHQEYDGTGGNNRFSIGDRTTSRHYHSAHVTGTIMASGVNANAKGMAPHGKAVGYDWNNDKSEATTAASNGMLISNHSYGYAARNRTGTVQLPQYYFGGYINQSRDWDQIMFNAPNYLMVVAAGNDGYDNTANTNPAGGFGFDKLTGHSTSKNNLVVANANDANISADGRLINVSINGSSSQGPTDDFRIKPDITGNGSGVYSTYEGSDTAYNSITGTSMASPNVSGSLLLLQQYYNNTQRVYMKAATLKGLVLHTADDIGVTGPDAISGWGLLNTKKAAETITNINNTSKIDELRLTTGQTYKINVNSNGTSPLSASISWTDRPGISNNTITSSPVLVNDLDIRLSKANTTYLPYKLTTATTSDKRDNNVDPYERIDITNPRGNYTITISHKGNLIGGGQNYSLIITGINECVNDLFVSNTINQGETDNQQASNTLTTTSTIKSNGTGSYNAGTNVILKTGFKVEKGAVFRAFIKECSKGIIANKSKKVQYIKNDLDSEYNTIGNFKFKENVTSKSIISIHPNPFTNTITINNIENINSWKLVNINGQIIKRGNDNNKINTSKMSKGIYILQVIFKNGEIERKKIIKE